MSNAKKCDICGKLYESYDGIEIVEGGIKYTQMFLTNGLRSEYFDLCEDCMTDLIEMIKKGQIKNG